MERARGMCELRCSPDCRIGGMPLDGDVLQRGHLSHGRSKRTYGWMESEENGQRHEWSCPPCHMFKHAGLKPCPPKPRP